MRTVLSIDGGGIRGIIPAVFLRSVEEITGKPCYRLFDLIAGTSTGGILALALSVPNVVGNQPLTAHECAKLYRYRGASIFSRSLWHRVLSLGGIIAEKFPADGLETVLRKTFGSSKLTNSLTHVLITTYDLERATPKLFDETDNISITGVARGTSAAPTYFDPAKVDFDEDDYRALVDGGLVANNPTLCALARAHKLWPEEEIGVISLGTGTVPNPVSYSKAKRFGAPQWIGTILNIMFNGSSATVDYQARQLLGNQYVRLQVQLESTQSAMDNVSQENLRSLFILGEELAIQKAVEVSQLLLKWKGPQTNTKP